MATAQRTSSRRAVKIAFAAAVIIAVAYAVVREWDALRDALASAHPRWGMLILSCALVLGNYALLVEAWRVVLHGWEGQGNGAGNPATRLGYWESARIWTISNLGRYVPGKVWQMGSMALMAQERGISGVGAAGSAVIVTLINTVAGFVVLAATGAGVLHVPPIGTAAIVALGVAILAAPRLLPLAGDVATRVTGRRIAVGRIPHRAIWIAAAISAISWVLYGFAFRAMAAGVTGHATGAPALYIAVFTGSYLVGFLALIVPGGVGVREVVMWTALRQAGFAAGEATLLVVASRIWLTILEIVPAILFLAHRWMRPRPRPRPRPVDASIESSR